MRRTVPKIVFFGVIFVFLAYLGITSSERGRIDYNRMRDRACVSRLKQVGLAISQFQDDNGGKMPPNLLALLPYVKDPTVLRCPYSSDAVGYACTSAFPKDPRAVLCWDKEPHRHKHGLFHAMPDTRSVLYAAFHVKVLKESDFQKLGLRGTRIAPPKQ